MPTCDRVAGYLCLTRVNEDRRNRLSEGTDARFGAPAFQRREFFPAVISIPSKAPLRNRVNLVARDCHVYVSNRFVGKRSGPVMTANEKQEERVRGQE